MSAPVLPEPTDETVEAHMCEWHPILHAMAAPGRRLTVHARYHADAIGEGRVAAFGHTHERSHDG